MTEKNENSIFCPVLATLTLQPVTDWR